MWEGLDGPSGLQDVIGALTEIGDSLSEARPESETTRSAAHFGDALTNLTLATNALIAAADIKCTLSQPPADVRTRPIGPGGSMIVKCFHKQAHCWDGVGRQITPCP